MNESNEYFCDLWFINLATIDIIYLIIFAIQEGNQFSQFISLTPRTVRTIESSSFTVAFSSHDPVHAFPAIMTFPAKTGIFARVTASGDGTRAFEQTDSAQLFVACSEPWSFHTTFESKRKKNGWSLSNWIYPFALFPTNLFIIYLYTFLIVDLDASCCFYVEVFSRLLTCMGKMKNLIFNIYGKFEFEFKLWIRN